jgi:hypothetical protein
MKFSIINFWAGFDNEKNDYVKFLFKDMEYTPDYENADIVLIGSFNYNEFIFSRIKGKKILYITEPWEYLYNNVNRSHCIFDVIMGCVKKNHSKNHYKLSFGLFHFYPFDEEKLNKRLENTNNHIRSCEIPKEFCSLISGHDRTNIRTPAYNALSALGHIVCPGHLYNNCSNEEVNRLEKPEYLKKFKFSICPENTLNLDGYLTEKLIECCLGGAIPVYAGNFDDIDAKIFNPNRILFYDYREESIQFVASVVEYLLNNPAAFEELYRRPIFMDTAAETIFTLKKELQDKVKSFLN